jgi:hypothetical protein
METSNNQHPTTNAEGLREDGVTRRGAREKACSLLASSSILPLFNGAARCFAYR